MLETSAPNSRESGGGTFGEQLRLDKVMGGRACARVGGGKKRAQAPPAEAPDASARLLDSSLLSAARGLHKSPVCGLLFQ